MAPSLSTSHLDIKILIVTGALWKISRAKENMK